MNIHVLIVEDDPLCAELMRIGLQQRTEVNYTVKVAHTLTEAIANLDGIEVVLLDLFLPDGRGVDVISRITAAGKNVGIVVLTGWADPELIAPAKAAGADAFLTKPAEAQDVSKKLQYVVIHRRCDARFSDVENSLAKMGELILRVSEISDNQQSPLPPPPPPPIIKPVKSARHCGDIPLACLLLLT